tara:strand:+ start:14885 stop:15172 length:288 start_codon:yes stop_codon:yes gene_type:complete
MIFKHESKEFDSSLHEFTLGDMAKAEELGVDFSNVGEGKKVSMKDILILSSMVFTKYEGTPDDFAKSIPVRRMDELGEFINDFFTDESVQEKESS